LLSKFQQGGAEILFSKQADLDGNNTTDWLVGASAVEENLWIREMLFTILDLGNFQYELVQFEKDYLASLNPNYLQEQYLKVPDLEVPIVFLRNEDYLTVFYIDYQPGNTSVINLFEEFDVAEIEIINRDGQLEIHIYEIDEWDTTRNFEWHVYRWESETKKFIPIDLATESILHGENPELGIPILNQVLAKYDELDANNSVYKTRLLYFLGLVYELSRNEVDAAHTYWQIWNDYPESPYALMARAKLEAITP
jgi:hypothetical protein